MDEKLLAERFKRFAEHECKGSSPLYEFLSQQISEDGDLLALSSFCSSGQPVPNLFLGSVHYLLLLGVKHELGEYYASLAKNPRSPEGSFLPFKDFCLQHGSEIIKILQSRRVQTNEVRRCTYLYPSFCSIYEKVKRPLALVELGTSAGLQLLWDKYNYSYGTEETYGDMDSSVHLSAKLRNGTLPRLPKTSPPVVSRIGIDLHVVDLSKEDEYIWLKALIWPEHADRMECFENAADCFQSQSAELIEGDAISLLPRVAGQSPDESVLCIFHTHVANQFSEAQKAKLLDTVRHIGGKQDVLHLYNNITDVGRLHLDSFIDGNESHEIVGDTDGHGRWFDWSFSS
ncbi:DUF2332 domain-containing protein [Alicyclobacillus sp. SO9]|uniref:DUF2332 domain-containing protein n=1 Tax=Alicyclobacillus sp. SO9 TaxID=2665646 RepID=UPI0018E6F99A|nr:DUF2332 domain-containing protein [Alicyclobacillus sp. SO9]QQE77197.1 DUF2332 domain-containing protein [Alicyclobacillus sp. SO9]